MKVYFLIAECSLSYAKIVQTRAMKACFQIAECSLSYEKIVQTVVGADAFLLPSRGGRERLRCAPQVAFPLTKIVQTERNEACFNC